MAYLDLKEPDPNRNRKGGLIMFIICVFYLIGITQCHGQFCVKKTYKTDAYGQISRTEACKSLMYIVYCAKPNGTVAEDTMFVGIYADNYGKDYDITIYILEPKSMAKIITLSLEIQLENNRIEKFLPTVIRFDSTTTYSEYSVTHEQYLRMKSMKYRRINFITNGQSGSIECLNGNYFTEFFKNLKQY